MTRLKHVSKSDPEVVARAQRACNTAFDAVMAEATNTTLPNAVSIAMTSAINIAAALICVAAKNTGLTTDVLTREVMEGIEKQIALTDAPPPGDMN